MTPVEQVQHLRVGKGRELLEFTGRTVDQIAWSAGYEDAGVPQAAPPDHRAVAQ